MIANETCNAKYIAKFLQSVRANATNTVCGSLNLRGSVSRQSHTPLREIAVLSGCDFYGPQSAV